MSLSLQLPVILLLIAGALIESVTARSDCHKLSIPICQGYGYTTTVLNKGEQRGVQLSILQLMSVGGDCDNILRPYLCYAFAPKCRKKYDHGILPCKSACKAVRRHCRKQLAALEKIPDELDCDNEDLFPTTKRPGGCLSGKKLARYSLTTGARPTTQRTTTQISTTQTSTTQPATTQTTTPPYLSTESSVTLPSSTTNNPISRSTTPRRRGRRTRPNRPRQVRRTTAAASSTSSPYMTSSLPKPSSTTTTKPSPEVTTVTIQTQTTARRGWVAKIRVTRPQTTTPLSVTKSTATTPYVRTTSLSTTTPTPKATTPYTGPVFNPFYPPEFGQVEDPRDRDNYVHRNRKTSSIAPTTTLRLRTTTEESTVKEQSDNGTTIIPWYERVDKKWLEKQFNDTIRYARGDNNQYTRDWDLSNYSRVMDEFERRLPLATPWYEQTYQDILSKVNWTRLRVRDENGTDITDSLSEDEIKTVYEDLFGSKINDGDNSDQTGGDNSAILEITITQDELREYRRPRRKGRRSQRRQRREQRESEQHTGLSDSQVFVGR